MSNTRSPAMMDNLISACMRDSACSGISGKLSDEQVNTLRGILGTNDNILVTGTAGSGKSAILALAVKYTPAGYEAGISKESGRAAVTPEERVVVTAFTGRAASFIRGCTINSFLGIGSGVNSAEQMVKGSAGKPEVV